jgi:hypothetical protein
LAIHLPRNRIVKRPDTATSPGGKLAAMLEDRVGPSFPLEGLVAAPGLCPERAEHDPGVQPARLKNTLRWMINEDVRTHLGSECHD